jgi:hypothetical protein
VSQRLAPGGSHIRSLSCFYLSPAAVSYYCTLGALTSPMSLQQPRPSGPFETDRNGPRPATRGGLEIGAISVSDVEPSGPNPLPVTARSYDFLKRLTRSYGNGDSAQGISVEEFDLVAGLALVQAGGLDPIADGLVDVAPILEYSPQDVGAVDRGGVAGDVVDQPVATRIV